MSLTELNTVKAGTVTMLVSGTSNLIVRQVGHVVAVWGYIGGMTLSANTTVQIAQITGVSMPPTAVRFRGAAGANAYTTGYDAYIGIESSGIIYVYPAGASTTVYFSAMWIA